MAGEGAKTAVGGRYHAVAADDVGEAFDTLRHQFWVFDEVGRCVKHAKHQDFVDRNFGAAPNCPFVLMAWIGGFEGNHVWLGFEDDGHDFFNADDVVMRVFVIAPADVHP